MKSWTLAKSSKPEDRELLEDLLYDCAESLRILALLVSPILPKAAHGIFDQLNWKMELSGKEERFSLADAEWGRLPDGHVTISDVRSGAFKKWTAAKIAETAKIAMYLRPVLSKTPKTIPRKKTSSMNGTAIEAKNILPKRAQAKLCRNA